MFRLLVTITIFLGAQTSFAQAKNSIAFELVRSISPFSNVQKLGSILDNDLLSPKSALFSADGRKVYINSLESGKTLVYEWSSVRKLKAISHKFTVKDQELFQGESTVFNYQFFSRPSSGEVNSFIGKPVEMTLSHRGRYLWITYYRRDFDKYAQSPSALAIVDTQTDEIIRVMPTGPLPKFVAVSPDNRWVAVTHWGDNTIGLIDISSGDPRRFRYVKNLIVEKAVDMSQMAGKDRDKNCGFCLRGTVFTADSRYLLVARMGGGGIAGFDVFSGEYLGTVAGMPPTPRHLILSADGRELFISSNASGYVSKIETASIIETLLRASGRMVQMKTWQAQYIGEGVRTIDLSPDGKVIYAAVNFKSQLVALSSSTLQVLGAMSSHPYPVGLAVAPDGSQVWVTAQGRDGSGGHVVSIFNISQNKY